MSVPAVSERKLLTVLAVVQFVNVFEFMIVMPLGPDFATALGIPLTRLGWVGAAYTLAASVAGLLGAGFLDRFARRRALIASLAGLAVATLGAALATGLYSLLAARVLAGLFGGPATALGYAIMADTVPPERRGRAMGVVLGAFSVASVLGVPLGLELARVVDWRLPFLAVAALTVSALSLARVVLPPLSEHLTRSGQGAQRSMAKLLSDRTVRLALLGTAVTMVSIFALVPHLSAFFQFNLGYPRERLGLLYLVGGAASFVAMRIGGRLVDRFGSVWVASAGTALLTADLVLGFISRRPWLPTLAIFVGMMLGNSIRAVAVTSLSTRVPAARERARFLSLQSAVQHAASALGALLSTSLLVEGPGHHLIGMPTVATCSLFLALTVPPLVSLIAADVRRREAAVT